MKLATRFSTRTSILSAHGNAPLEDSAIRAAAPSIFADSRHSSRSDRYTYIPTSNILTGLRREGFQPYQVVQGGSRIEGKADFTKHMIRLRHPDISRTGTGETPELILINSHDGTSSYQLLAGLFRFVCFNGLVCGDELGEVRVPHRGDIVGQVIDGCVQLVKDIPYVLDSVASFKSLTLTDGEQRAFATAAHATRFEADSPVQADKLLTPKRSEDATSDLWAVFNRVQENVIRGGTGYVQNSPTQGRSFRRTREVKSIDQTVGINRALWVLAEEMKKLKA